MLQIGLIGTLAGAASALLFGSSASGSLLAVPLFYLSPLPIFVAALGWSQVAGLIAALVAAVVLAAIFSPFYFIGFLLSLGLPAWWLGYLALLARPVDGLPGHVEWYPPGRLVVWAAVLAGVSVCLVLFTIASDADELRAILRKAFEPLFQDPRLGRAGSEQTLMGQALLVSPHLTLPPAAAIITTGVASMLLYLGGLIVRASGRLRRPWPDVRAMTFPPTVTVALAILLLATFLLGGMFQVIAVVFSAALLTATAMLGLAVTHAITRNTNGRGFILGAVYGSLFVFGWPLLLFALLGLADMVLDLRARFGRPAAPNT